MHAGGVQITMSKDLDMVVLSNNKLEILNGGIKVVENLTENQVKIIELINENKFISAKEIAKYIKISPRKVQENISKLKSKGIIQRIGPAKGGFWKVMNNG